MRSSAHGSDVQTPQLLARARSVAPSAGQICAIVAEEFSDDWRYLASGVATSNLFSLLRGESTQSAIGRALVSLGLRDPRANIVLIPADHCAAEENAWVVCAKNAIRLGASNTQTVIVLHDKPENDPRVSPNYPGVCSSSVMIGSLQAVQALCAGVPATPIVDLDLDDTRVQAKISRSSAASTEVVHITSVEEYARLQRGEYGRTRSLIDLRA